MTQEEGEEGDAEEEDVGVVKGEGDASMDLGGSQKRELPGVVFVVLRRLLQVIGENEREVYCLVLYLVFSQFCFLLCCIVLFSLVLSRSLGISEKETGKERM